MTPRSFFSELTRRRVFRTAVVYAVAGWAVMEVADVIFPRLALPEWSVTLVVVLVFLGFPIALGLAWAFDVTPAGIVRTGAERGVGAATLPAGATAPTAATEPPGSLAAREPPTTPAVASSSRHDDRPSVAVLPFANLSPDPENAYFSDGLTEEVIADLSVVQGLRVTSRTSVMQFREADRDLRSIARALGVRYVLEGSVRRAGSDLRVTAQLIEAETDSHLWAEKYSGSATDVFAIQEQISRKIVGALEVQLTVGEERRLGERPIEDLRAWEAYLRARREMYRFTEESLDRAVELLRSALAGVGENALLHATLGQVYEHYFDSGLRLDERYLDEAERCVERVFVLDPDSAHGFFLRGLIRASRGEVGAGVADMRRARRADPNNANVLGELVRRLSESGQDDDADEVVGRLLDVDPLAPITHAVHGYLRLVQGRFEDAAAAYERARQLDPASPFTRSLPANALARCGQREEAMRQADELARTSPTIYGAFAGLFACSLRGEQQEFLRRLTPDLEHVLEHTAWIAFNFGGTAALVGLPEVAMRWLGAAVRRGFIHYPFLAERDPFLAGLRGDPAFQALMEVVRKRWESFAA